MRRSVVALAARLQAGLAQLQHGQAAMALLVTSPGRQGVQASAAALARSFRGSAACQTLAEALRNELAYEKQNYVQPEELSAGPPAGFTLAESRGDTLMSLTKQHGDERVTVDVMVNNQPEEELVEDESGAIDADVGAVFTAAITKGGRSLVFECKSDGQYFAILHASLEPASSEVEDSAYTGPVYEELDEELQRQFEEYLAERGVDVSIGKYLLPLIHDKEQREYVQWLEEVQRFVQAQ